MRMAADPLLAGLAILIVEDEALQALELERLMQRLGSQQVRSVESVATALEHLQGERPDLVLLDVELSDGWAARLALALSATRVPFVVVSGHGRLVLRHDPALRAAPYVGKPVELAKLQQAIRDALAADAAFGR
jgi:DNA-binding NtrC family response regulator